MADLTTNEYRGLPQKALKLALQKEARAIGILGPKAFDTGETVETSFPFEHPKHARRGRITSLLSLFRLPRRYFSFRLGQRCHWRESI